MGWQPDSEKLSIKARVRHRDGNCCVVCDMRNDIHEYLYGKQLEVHRLVPGSDYDVEWGVCVTLCDVCHDALHGQGSWGWITRYDPENEEQLAWRVERSTRLDADNESERRQRAAWGDCLREVRKNVVKLSERHLAILLGVRARTVQDWEAGRSEPRLSEAKRLAKALKALGYTLDPLSWGGEPDDGWLEYARDRSEARALAFGAREAQEGDFLGRGAGLVSDFVREATEKRKAARRIAIQVGPPTFRFVQPPVKKP